MKKNDPSQHCAICGCKLEWGGGQYGKPSPEGRAHGTRHHSVAERFFGRSANRKGTQREKIFDHSPWETEGHVECFCYECHEEMLHNPVLLPADIKRLADLVRARGLAETGLGKSWDRSMIAGRIALLHEVIRKGLEELTKKP